MTTETEIIPSPRPKTVTDGIIEREEHGIVVLAPADRRPFRRVVFVNCYGGASVWKKIKEGEVPPHHLWGCIELARMGYEVALAEPLPDFYLYRKPLPHDLRLWNWIRDWLGRDGILYCGHNVLYWVPFLKQFGLVRARVVSLLYGREPLKFSRAHSGIIALNGAAADHIKKLAPRAQMAHLGWGVDLNFFPRVPFRPGSFLSCGITQRDHPTLSEAAKRSGCKIRVICPGLPKGIEWPPNVQLIDSGPGFNVEKKRVTYKELLLDHYADCVASLIILKRDPTELTGCGFTNLIEAMAMARPVIVTRTGALPTEIDVDKAGCGFQVPPEDSAALAKALETLANDPQRAEAMGEKGRQLAESHYNIDRFSRGLHEFFQKL